MISQVMLASVKTEAELMLARDKAQAELYAQVRQLVACLLAACWLACWWFLLAAWMPTPSPRPRPQKQLFDAFHHGDSEKLPKPLPPPPTKA